jgi:hypothetical protein
MSISQSDVHIVHESQIETTSADKEQRLRESSFLITIVSNFRTKDAKLLKPKVVEFYNTLEKLFANPSFVARCIDIIPFQDSEADLLAVTMNTGVEYSRKSGIHAHTQWTIYHTTQVRMALNPMRLNLSQAFAANGWKPMYVDVRFDRSKGGVRAYVFKTIKGKRTKVPESVASLPGFGSGQLVCTNEMALSDQLVI